MADIAEWPTTLDGSLNLFSLPDRITQTATTGKADPELASDCVLSPDERLGIWAGKLAQKTPVQNDSVAFFFLYDSLRQSKNALRATEMLKSCSNVVNTGN